MDNKIQQPDFLLLEAFKNGDFNALNGFDGNNQLAALYYIDPRRFDSNENDLDITAGLSARVVEQNMSVSTPQALAAHPVEYADDIIPVRRPTPVNRSAT